MIEVNLYRKRGACYKMIRSASIIILTFESTYRVYQVLYLTETKHELRNTQSRSLIHNITCILKEIEQSKDL